MDLDEIERLRYPTGKYQPPAEFTPTLVQTFISEIAALPIKLAQALAGLTDAQLDSHYRPGGWTLRQVAHHVPDSHLNAYQRMRLALTEEAPVIKLYEESRWAELPDAKHAPIQLSLALLQALHQRWVYLLTQLREADLLRPYVHPQNGETPLRHAIGLYAWHGNHHLHHILGLRERMGW